MSDIEKGVEWLIANEPLLAEVIAKAGPCTLQKHTDPFNRLVKAVVSQQISTKAADSIFKKVLNLMNGSLEPKAILSFSTEELRSAGLSGQKVSYLKNLAEHFLQKPEFYENLESQTDEQLIAELVSIKGIGIWSAQMFLMFTLCRINILPVDDLGLKKGMQVLYSLPQMPDKKTMQAIAAEKWGSYKSIATWYMWRLIEFKN
ncbi:MAG: DNA-3-methyladenine glycosylase [Bacteroidota bacterium]